MRLVERAPSKRVVFGRLLECQRCGAHVDVIEIPTVRIDPREYVCPDHWAPIIAARAAIADAPPLPTAVAS